MTTFPALQSSATPRAGGQWRTASHQALGGGTTTVLLDMVERERKWSPTFGPIDQATWEQILEHFREHGTFQGFEFDQATLSPSETSTGYWWRWIQPPQVSDPHAGMREVRCDFELVPIVHQRFGGERLGVVVDLQPGDQPEPPEPEPVLRFGGERLVVTAQIETRSTRNLPGQALATITLAAGATGEGAFILPGALAKVLGWETNRRGWLRLYGSAASAAADSARTQAQAPPSAAGIILDPALESAGGMEFQPLEEGRNLEVPRSDVFPFRFTNLGDAGEVRLVIHYEPATSIWS